MLGRIKIYGNSALKIIAGLGIIAYIALMIAFVLVETAHPY